MLLSEVPSKVANAVLLLVLVAVFYAGFREIKELTDVKDNFIDYHHLLYLDFNKRYPAAHIASIDCELLATQEDHQVPGACQVTWHKEPENKIIVSMYQCQYTNCKWLKTINTHVNILEGE